MNYCNKGYVWSKNLKTKANIFLKNKKIAQW